jgi:hypothetical protein
LTVLGFEVIGLCVLLPLELSFIFVQYFTAFGDGLFFSHVCWFFFFFFFFGGTQGVMLARQAFYHFTSPCLLVFLLLCIWDPPTPTF